VKNKFYYKDGSVLDFYDNSKMLHRVDGPAIEYADGRKDWFIDGKRHREDGPACEWVNGDTSWYFDGKLHRVNGPTVEWADGSKYWWIDGNRHRLDGPARIYSNGYKDWWIDGNMLTEEEFDNHPKVQNYRFQLLLEEVLSER